MQQLMKRIVISDKCVACGVCVVSSELLTETPQGHAVPLELGIITEEEYLAFREVELACPVGAISVQDERITGLDGTEALVKLKALITEKLENFSIPFPSDKDYDFDQNEYEAPPLLTRSLSSKTYRSYDKANDAGYYAFKDSMYSQRKALIQAVCIQYKTRQLKKYSYYEKIERNYFYEINQEVSKLLKEVAVLGQAISNNQMQLPENFSEFDVGPDQGFDGDSYCYPLRNIDQFDWTEKMEEADHYRTYINVDDYGNEYKYSLDEVEETFRKDIVFGLYLQFYKHVDPVIKQIYDQYLKAFRLTINQKLSLLKTELKKYATLEENSEAKEEAIVQAINSLLSDVKSTKLQKETVFHSVDTSYDSSFRFSSYSQASEAAGNRIWRFYKECSNYLETGYGDRISVDLAARYQIQFEGIIDSFKKKMQSIYDKFAVPYPNVVVELNGGDYRISVNLSDYENVCSNMNWDIRKYIDAKVIGGWGAGVKKDSYFSYDLLSYDIHESITWKQGIFGEKEVPVFCYLLDTSNCQNGFFKAVNACNDYVFESDYLNTLLSNLLLSIESEVQKKIISKGLLRKLINSINQRVNAIQYR